MNWRSIKGQFKILQLWSENSGYDSLLVPLKMVALILRGCDKPEIIAAFACSNIRLRDIVDHHFLQKEFVELPDEIHELLSRWVHTLPRDPMLLGAIYESVSPGRRVRGLYYTPPDVIAFILDKTVRNYDITMNPKIRILDPACGCGNFLLMAYDVLYRKFTAARDVLVRKYPEEDWSDDGIRRHILQYNLWGADIDPIAGDLAAVSLYCKGNGADAQNIHIIAYDSLKKPENGYANNEKMQDFWFSKYDFVIGNPPYLSFGLRGTSRLDSAYTDYLRREYSASAQYKLSYYVLFMQRGLDMLEDGGQLGYIVPDSFLLGRYYSKIRRYILEQAHIDAIAHITAGIFRKAATGYLAVTILTKRTDPVAREADNLSIYKIDSGQSFEKAQPCCTYKQTYFSALPFNRFRLFFDARSKLLIDRLDGMSRPLKEFASGHTGIRSISCQSHIIATEQQGCNWHRGLISGKQVQRYGINYEGHWLHIEPGLLYKGGWNKDIVEQRKILVRQTGFTPVASIDFQGFYHLNNIHSFVLTTGKVSLDYLLILLNSKLISFYYHIVSMEYGRSMAQTDIETIELLPVVFDEHLNHIASELVDTMEYLTRAKLDGDNDAAHKLRAFDDYIDQLVYHTYCLSDADVSYVEEQEMKLSQGRKASDII